MKAFEKIDTQKELAKIAGVSHDTIARVEKIVQKAPEEVLVPKTRPHIMPNPADLLSPRLFTPSRKAGREIDDVEAHRRG